jgi:hypothetical protein
MNAISLAKNEKKVILIDALFTLLKFKSSVKALWSNNKE